MLGKDSSNGTYQPGLGKGPLSQLKNNNGLEPWVIC